MSIHQPPTARAKEAILGDEEAGKELRLGEFQDAVGLTLSEARTLMTVIFEHRRDAQKFKVPDNEIVTKTQSYLEVFSRFKQQETAQAVERILLQQKDLTSFERAQLGKYAVWWRRWYVVDAVWGACTWFGMWRDGSLGW